MHMTQTELEIQTQCFELKVVANRAFSFKVPYVLRQIGKNATEHVTVLCLLHLAPPQHLSPSRTYLNP